MSINILSTGGYVPDNPVDNSFFESFLDTSDEWISTRTGMKTRNLSCGENATELGIKAAKQAFKRSGLSAEDIDLVICSTVTPHSRVPTTAALIRDALGINHAVAFDLNAACTGFIYAVTVAKSLMETMGYRNAIIVGSEALSQITDYTDRGSCILFADGAGAAVIGQGSGRGIIAEYIDSVTDKEDVLTCSLPVLETPFTSPSDENIRIAMDGKKVFVFAVGAMTSAIKEVLGKSGVSLDDVKYIVPHQANIRIILSVAGRMKLPMERFFVNIDHTGNTSSASVPLALDELYQSGCVSRGDLILLVGFGGGLTYGATLFEV